MMDLWDATHGTALFKGTTCTMYHTFTVYSHICEVAQEEINQRQTEEVIEGSEDD